MKFNKKSYEAFDLFIFTLIACVVEGLNVFVFNMMTIKIGEFYFNQIYTLSFAALLGMIAIFRWSAHGLIVAPLAGLTSVLVRFFLHQEVSVNLWLAFSVGYFALAVCLLFFHKRDKTELRKDKGMMIFYYFAGYLSLEVVRALCQIGVANYWVLLLDYVAFDLINIVFSFLVFLIALKQDSLIVDMNLYLEHLHDITEKLGGQDVVSRNININVEELAEADEINEAAILDGGTLSREDLKMMEAYRRKFEHRESKYDRENEELESYRKEKEAATHGGR
jgi:hypothetical protein